MISDHEFYYPIKRVPQGLGPQTEEGWPHPASYPPHLVRKVAAIQELHRRLQDVLVALGDKDIWLCQQGPVGWTPIGALAAADILTGHAHDLASWEAHQRKSDDEAQAVPVPDVLPAWSEASSLGTITVPVDAPSLAYAHVVTLVLTHDDLALDIQVRDYQGTETYFVLKLNRREMYRFATLLLEADAVMRVAAYGEKSSD
ncbi:MAG: hypothetical protein V3U45_04210 [bacterium]